MGTRIYLLVGGAAATSALLFAVSASPAMTVAGGIAALALGAVALRKLA